MNEQLPYQVTEAARRYEGLTQLPAAVLLDNIRSLYNVGSFFRTGDAAGIEKLYLSGYTGDPDHLGLKKTALGAEETVPWARAPDPVELVERLRTGGWEIAAVETSIHAVDLFEWVPRFPVLVMFGNECDGLSAELSARADRYVRIPMLGKKHSLNVGVAGGVTLYELLRKYLGLMRR
jgi:23S rRNA (guanosine2251-2'-O)-methyltransferase